MVKENKMSFQIKYLGVWYRVLNVTFSDDFIIVTFFNGEKVLISNMNEKEFRENSGWVKK